jgi:beta-lactamase regulating signal transducer with metallopeptidase domain
VNPLAPATWWLVVAGWSVLVTLWHTTVIALAFVTWRLWRHEASARRQYLAAAVALALASVFTLATPAVLMIGGRSAGPVPPATARLTAIVGTPAAHAAAAPSPMTGPVALGATARAVTTIAAPWIGAAWCLGFAIGVIRLAGGWAVAQWIRRRAVAVPSPQLVDAARDAAAMWDLPAAPVLASAHVEAPVVIGARAPAVLLPVDLEQRLDAAALRPLLAHEFAHVDRRDYAANLLQSFADTLLFFSPGARWLSRSVREAREYCCDDLVAARCGPCAYASALTTLAGLGVAARARPVVNAAGPRLIVRIRRLLQEDAMIPFAGFRVTGLFAVLVVVAAGGSGVVGLSASGIERATPVHFTAPIEGPVPMGFIHTQRGLAVRLRDMTSSDAASCGTATLENRANVAVTGVRFAAQAMAGGPEGSSLSSVLSTSSPLLDVDIQPGATASVAANLVSLDDLRGTIRTGSPQVMCAIVEVRYANGWAWTSPPAIAFAPTQAEVARALIGRPPVPGATFCRDQDGGEYSDGAIVPIALEPGPVLARCHDGAWGEYVLPAMQPDAAR